MSEKEGLETISQDFYKIQNEMRLIGINARIEASKATKKEGRRFSIIAEEVSKSANKISSSLEQLEAYIQRINK